MASVDAPLVAVASYLPRMAVVVACRGPLQAVAGTGAFVVELDNDRALLLVLMLLVLSVSARQIVDQWHPDCSSCPGSPVLALHLLMKRVLEIDEDPWRPTDVSQSG